MNARPTVGTRGAPPWSLWAAVCCAGLLTAGPAPAQENRAAAVAPPKALMLPAEPAPAPPVPKTSPDPGVEQASCKSCGSGHGGSLFGGGCGPGGCGAGCYPGRRCDHECGTHQGNAVARVWNGFYECLCCPDPCYDPRWVAAANSAFFADQVRPQTQMRLRWDAMRNGLFRDRAEFIHARADGRGKGPRTRPVTFFDNDEFSYYMEGATQRFGLFVEMPYRSIDPEFTPVESGFADMSVGTKSLLLDCELMQVTFQFTTFIPIGQASKGLGTGHVSLEPSILSALKLGPDTYFQCQVAYRIPIGGDPDYAGDVFHYHFSLNHVLWRPLTGVQIIGTAELSGWSILDGQYTQPVGTGGVPVDARGNLLGTGPGVRLVICDKIDFGVGALFAVTQDKLAEQFYRAEFRWRF